MAYFNQKRGTSSKKKVALSKKKVGFGIKKGIFEKVTVLVILGSFLNKKEAFGKKGRLW